VLQPDAPVLRAFIVEDEALVSMLLEDMLADLGCIVVDTAARVGDAVDKAALVEADIAILDVNLDGVVSYSVADALLARGVAVIFSTGYVADALPPRFAAAPKLNKPFSPGELKRALDAARAHFRGRGSS
jgi:CheY-like chemotaxis protein